VVQNLTSLILVYVGMLYAIYHRHRNAWIAIEKLPVEAVIIEQDMLKPLQAEFAEKGINTQLLEED